MTTTATATPTSVSAKTVAKGGWYAIVLLFAINFLNFFDRFVPSVVLEPIRNEFALNDVTLGFITTAFTLIYAVAGIPLGRIADIYPRKYVLAGGIFFWSVVTGAVGFAWNFWSFLMLRVGVGIGEASCAPAANSMIGDLFPSEKRARALGTFMLGLPVAIFAAYLSVGWLAHMYGWRVPFFIAAIPGLIVAALALFIVEPVRGSREVYKIETAKAVDRPFKRVLSIQTLWWIILSGVVFNFAIYAITTFMTALLMRYHGLNIAQAGGLSSVSLGLSGVIGLTVGGWVADKLHQTYAHGRLTFGAVSLLAAGALNWFGLSQPVGNAVLLTVMVGAGWTLAFTYYVTVYSSIQDVVEPRLRATAMAIYFFFQYVLGAAFGTTVTGALSDYYARNAMHAAGASEMTATFRASGLQGSVSLLVPVCLILTGIAIWLATRSFVEDANMTKTAAQVPSA